MLRAVLDPGVLIAALLSPQGAPAQKTWFLISGDAHLTQLDALEPPVLTPRAFLSLLTKDTSQNP
ncbi:MAG: hypothetical protein D6819_06840 [Gammaproteobacteria bacterium]|nr:MAG: hypothetical protein D6819_06840 [Gammaproteobacteria bacterium]